MKRKAFTPKSFLMAGLLGVLLLFSLASQATAAFRFLTTSLPDGTTSREYFAVLLTANAQGTVTYGVTNLPSGLTLNTSTGYITGKPNNASNYSLTVTANDGTSTISYNQTVHISASGGGGSGGLGITTSSLATGRVGVDYSASVSYTDGSSRPPYIWGAQNLPIGLSLNGLTGAITGTPISAGTFYVTFTLTNGAPAQIITTIPITIYPVDSLFKFTTYLLDNGEIGSTYTDTWITSGAPTCPPPSYLASHLCGFRPAVRA